MYPFRGRAEIFPYARDGSPAYFGGAQSLAVSAWEFLSLDIASPYTYAERKALARDRYDYWRTNDFSGSSPLPKPDTRIAAFAGGSLQSDFPESGYASPPPAAVLPAIPNETPSTVSTQVVMTRNRHKNIALTLGLSLMLLSVGTQVVCSQVFSLDNLYVEGIHNTAYGSFGLGAVTALAGILFNPIPDKR